MTLIRAVWVQWRKQKTDFSLSPTFCGRYVYPQFIDKEAKAEREDLS